MDRFETFPTSRDLDHAGADEVDLDVALHLEAWTDETSAELFARACRTLREAGIRVKAGYAPGLDAGGEDAQHALSALLYPDRG